MLSSIRTFTTGFFARILIALLVASFAVWGIGDIVNRQKPSIIATVGNVSIPLARYEHEIRKLRESFGDNYSPEFLKSFNLYQLKLMEMVNRQLLEMEAHRLGILVSDGDLLRTIAQNQMFQNSAGKFDKPLFHQTLTRMGMSERTFLEELRNDLSSQLLVKTFSLHSPAPQPLIDEIYKAKYEKRKVMVVVSNKAPAITIQSPSESDLNAFYETQKARYRAPEYRALRFVFIAPDEILGKVTVSREEAVELYKQRSPEMTQPERREVEQLLYDTKAEADKAFARLTESKDIELVAKEIPPLNQEERSLGFVTREELPTAADEIFSLEAGWFTPPQSSPFGWHIFRLLSVREQATPDFETIRPKLEEEIRRQKADQALLDVVEQLEDRLAGGAAMKTAAKDLDLHFVTTDPIDRQGKEADTNARLDPAIYEPVIRDAFNLASGERSEVTSTPQGAYYIVEAPSVIGARQRAFEEVRGQLIQDWTEMKKKASHKIFAQSLAKKLAARSEESELKALLASEDVTAHIATIDRMPKHGEKDSGSMDRHLLAALTNDVFSLPGKGAVTTPVSFEGSVVFAVLLDTLPPPDPVTSEEGKKEYATLSRSLKEDYTQEILGQYLASLRARYTVQINEETLESVIESE